MIHGQCHCGNIKLSLDKRPETLTSCNCSVCSRYGSLWGYYPENKVAIVVGEHEMKSYCWGDRYINFHHCGNCGSVTHYTSTEKANSDKVGVNFRMFDENIRHEITIRRFDGADTWTFLE